MKQVRVLVLAVCLCMAAGPAGAAPSSADPHADEKTEVATSVNAFGLDLYGRVRGEKGNVFLSPYSVSSALAMTWAGARGQTADEMAAALRVPPDWRKGPERLHAAYGHLNTALGAEGKAYELSVANALWGQQGYGFLGGFLALLESAYGAGLREVDFAGRTEASRGIINTWVEKKTNEKIKDLIPPGGVQATTRLVLTNAIYFNGTWESPFEKDRTRDADFFTPGGKVTVPMMGQGGYFAYGETAGCQMLQIPYKGQDLAMVVLLPTARQGLAAVEKSLTAEGLAKHLASLKTERVSVSLPRFRTTWSALLADPLQAMGMSRAFNAAKADFTGMNGGKEPLWIGEVIHKAFVDVNEQGTEAAAATAVIMVGAGPPAKPVHFRADHPFLFLIRDVRSGAILFLGRVVDPKG